MPILNEKKYNFRLETRLVAYRLTLPPELDRIHTVFHVSMLRRYRSDLSHVISSTVVEIQPDTSYSEEPIKILA
ncbi:receptor-like protein kinase [Gossypium australe]|uniref:Receptor-like protein kinase n=1 Tax=Gossypium australe TaxID=47621 RepID=A0A5B6VCF4_9ROSI|nr:receptor-like protein kinase [Gossypium australe]